ncbi:hypothetical protein Moror_12546 [Moniliophthora roreri MCA 2997]|uniref:Uncharacterized protein n=2 Tax=Moniliophthora roreri TaxID=221103 RepID=V2YVH5_MONRO|nr:hypothetical protein Moror_12546 [Moniliophthora roreri MCA 2997]KAI3621175.1 hypothetical protein WG66_014455 [Moniliophthora roreri]
MALTQTATIPGPGPSWDEEVVPALRKRLESESRTIARRLSAISMSSVEDSPSETYRERTVGSSSYNTSQPFHTSFSSRPAQQSRQDSDRSVNSTRVNGASSSSAIRPPSRTRTQSQPYKQDPVNARMNGGYSKANGAAGSSDTYSISNSSSRPLSPNTNIKPSRIPQPARNRTASLSSNNYTPSLNGRSTSPYPSPYPPAQTPGTEMYQASDLWKVREVASQSQSTISVVSKQRSGLLNEQPPFKSSTAMNPSDESLYDSPPRPSIESEERPFEHWYRGDVSRNGGVGELRVGKRQEMMDIANYGHSMKANTPASRNAITDAIDRRRRKRAGSLAVDRTSFYMDEEKAEQASRVLDENPLTDVEGEMSSDTGSMSDYQDRDEDDTMDVNISTSSAPLPSSNYDGRTTPTPANYSRPSSRNQNAPSRIPGPRTTTPTPPQFQRGMSEPPSLPSSSVSTPSNTRTKQQAQLRSTSTSPNGTPTSNGKRGASPGVASTSNKKSRMNATKATQAKLAAKKKEEEEARKKSVASYPSPGDESDMAHAIPTWTEPVPRQGNWDEVVLPAVARKKGLAGHFEEADGSPKVKKEVNTTAAPAPGTFGYDHSKYRPPRNDEDIPMDEFGRQEVRGEETQSHSYTNSQQQVQPIPTNPYDETRIPHRPQFPPSPEPFSYYAPRVPNGVPTQPTADTEIETKPQQKPQQYPELEDKDEGGGCCKCVIM